MNLMDEPGFFPIYFMRGTGCYVEDIDGNHYIDYICGKGSVILGHAHQAVTSMVVRTIRSGNMPPLNHPLQNALAAILKRHIGNAQRVRLFRTGSCATSAAVRLARVFTGRELILTSGYHGWHDWCQPGRSGVPKAVAAGTIDFRYSLALLEELASKHKGEVAAVFVTPEPCFYGANFYREVERIAHRLGSLFILDEVKTGFRFSMGGAQEVYGIEPHLATYSKAMANGFPISALTGSAKVMECEERTHLSGTFDIEITSIAAAVATLGELEDGSVHKELQARGMKLINGLNALFEHHGIVAACTDGNPAGFHIIFQDQDLAKAFYRQCANRNILFYPFNNVNLTLAHTQQVIHQTLSKCDSSLAALSVRTGVCDEQCLEAARERYMRRHHLV